MSALPLPDFEITTPQELASYLCKAQTWHEVEGLTSAYAHLKTQAWELLMKSEQEQIHLLKKWQDSAVAQKFPPGCMVQRKDDSEGLTGKVIDYWQAYGVDYVTFQVGLDRDWCRASNLKRVSLL